ncbi:uncharacterized protein LAJ45_05728 [Morchella importuna]|uniref:uncharacterized protein n=1 Tax=Morchella importuna TaxID=1174673 RepID=UPI001E8E77C8|nr:uncharacterized protein LAJ45_05728 [Morchella importuna]KAH8150042.1 hypothetical protein LAJ45_05728 [Morchella importuna]
MVERLCSLGCPDNIAKDLSILTLYNIILIVRQPRSPTTTAADRLIDALLDIANLSQIKKKNPVSVPPWPYRSFIPWIWEIISLFLQPDMIFPSAGNLGGRQRDGVGYLYINITGVETSNTSRNYRCRSDWVDIKPARNHIGLQFSVFHPNFQPTRHLRIIGFSWRRFYWVRLYQSGGNAGCKVEVGSSILKFDPITYIYM